MTETIINIGKKAGNYVQSMIINNDQEEDWSICLQDLYIHNIINSDVEWKISLLSQ